MKQPLPLGIGSISEWLAALYLPLTDLWLVLCALFFAGVGRYLRRDVNSDGRPDTFCNIFSQDVAEAFGLDLPRNTRANDLIPWLRSQAGKDAGWVEVAAKGAQAHADEGGLGFACRENPSGPGHIAPLCPSLGESGIWISNVGATNFLRGHLAQGFGTEAGISFFINTLTP